MSLHVGATTEDTIVERIAVALLPTYLSTIINVVDADNNAKALDTDNDFTTPAPSIVISENVARQPGHPIEVLVTSTGQTRSTEIEILDQAPHSATLPRLDIVSDIALVTRVSSTQGSWGQDGARRRCNRIHRALRIIMSKYPQLDVPGYSGGALGALVQGVEIVGDERDPRIEEQGWTVYARRLECSVRTIEYLAE